MSKSVQVPMFDVAAMAVPEDAVRFTIRGEAASKANSRNIVTIKGRPSSIKSKKALSFEASAMLQIPADARRMFAGLVGVELRMHYRTMQPDLDESIVLDVLQAKFSAVVKDQPRTLQRRGVYVNDRQVWHKRVTRGLDPADPRIEVAVWPLSQEVPA